MIIVSDRHTGALCLCLFSHCTRMHIVDAAQTYYMLRLNFYYIVLFKSSVVELTLQ